MGKRKRQSRASSEPLIAALANYKRPERASFEDAWVGLEPTFTSERAMKRWLAAARREDEDSFFEDEWMLDTQRALAKRIARRYRRRLEAGARSCVFASVELERDEDQWENRRYVLHYRFEDEELDDHEVKVTLDPEVFEYSIKPIPLAWFYEDRYVEFLQEHVWDPPQALGLSPVMAHGGGQFSFSAKSYLQGSLLADDVATRLAHPELATLVMDYPNPDDRSFRTTRERRAAFERTLAEYWEGRYHPRATGVLTAENAYCDRGFEPARDAAPRAMDRERGPIGDAREVFQTNFAFGRALRLRAQNVHPGYWKSAHPEEDGYRPDQVMRYSEGNLNRLQIRGELHVKSGEVLESDDVPELETPLALELLAREASWEIRAQMTQTSARDCVEALLLSAHHARWLQSHPGVTLPGSLLQDQLLGDADDTLRKRAPKTLRKLEKKARAENAEDSHGRIRSARPEPEALYWAAWHALDDGERAAIAREALAGFLERVEQAATADPRPAARTADPMGAHRHRVHPLVWEALAHDRAALSKPQRRELEAWEAQREECLARRPAWGFDDAAPWERG